MAEQEGSEEWGSLSHHSKEISHESAQIENGDADHSERADARPVAGNAQWEPSLYYDDLTRHDQLVLVEFSVAVSTAEIDDFIRTNRLTPEFAEAQGLGLMPDHAGWGRKNLLRTNGPSATALIPVLNQSPIIHFAHPVFTR